jgi:uncharacterized protein (DUF1015 family)
MNAESFLHVSRPEIDLPLTTSPYDAQVYDLGRRHWESLQSRGVLTKDGDASYFIYRLRQQRGSTEHTQTGIAATFSVDEYNRNLIAKHEKTRKDKEDDRTRHILALQAQTGPVFLTYRDRPLLSALLVEVVQSHSPLYDFVSEDGVAHSLWRIPHSHDAKVKSEFLQVPRLFIADGHHRAASASRAHAERGTLESSKFLAVAFAASELRILPYHRLTREGGPLSWDQVLKDLTLRFGLRPCPNAPTPMRGEFGLYAHQQWYQGSLARLSTGDSLDVSRLQDQILSPLIGIGDPRTDQRIDFVGGIRGTQELERRVDSGDSQAAWTLHPTSIEELFAVSEAGGIMPPKST